jgi:hypothetical protein
LGEGAAEGEVLHQHEWNLLCYPEQTYLLRAAMLIVRSNCANASADCNDEPIRRSFSAGKQARHEGKENGLIVSLSKDEMQVPQRRQRVPIGELSAIMAEV